MNRDISPWKMSSTTLNDRDNNEEKAARFELLLRSRSIVIEDDNSARYYKNSFQKDKYKLGFFKIK